MFKKIKENKKGFTLVELIVVLVILAILAALLVPALTGYIDKAKEKAIIAETRQCVMAAQTLADESYGTKTIGGTVTFETGTRPESDATADIYAGDIQSLAEVSGTVAAVTFDDTNKATIKTLTYQGTNGKTCTYTKPTNATSGTNAYVVTTTTEQN